jgi:hypothetical protein
MTSTLDSSTLDSSTLDSFPPPTTEPVSAGTAERPPDPSVPPNRPRRHSAGHVIAMVVGALALFPGFGLLVGGTAAAVAQGVATDDGYFTFTPDRVASDGVAVITDDAWLDADDGGPWVLDWLDVDVRLRADGAGTTDDVFVGIARTDDVEAYLVGTTHSVVDEIDGRDVRYRQQSGDASVAAPGDLDIWVASADGLGEQELTWEARGGRWTVVVMNADATPGVTADVEVGVRSDAVTPIAVTLIVLGGLTVLASVGLIVFGARGRRLAS